VANPSRTAVKARSETHHIKWTLRELWNSPNFNSYNQACYFFPFESPSTYMRYPPTAVIHASPSLQITQSSRTMHVSTSSCAGCGDHSFEVASDLWPTPRYFVYIHHLMRITYFYSLKHPTSTDPNITRPNVHINVHLLLDILSQPPSYLV